MTGYTKYQSQKGPSHHLFGRSSHVPGSGPNRLSERAGSSNSLFGINSSSGSKGSGLAASSANTEDMVSHLAGGSSSFRQRSNSHAGGSTLSPSHQNSSEMPEAPPSSLSFMASPQGGGGALGHLLTDTPAQSGDPAFTDFGDRLAVSIVYPFAHGWHLCQVKKV